MLISPTYLGDVGITSVFRISLADFQLSTIGSIAVFDDRAVSGAVGAGSGFDLDFITVSNRLTSTASTAASLAPMFFAESVFSFNSAQVAFKAGLLSRYQSSDSAALNSSNLFGAVAGTNNATPDLASITLNLRDATMIGGGGALSLGEGGALSFTLDSSVDPRGIYLYFGGVGGGNIPVFVDAGASRSHALLPSGLTLRGTSEADDLRLGVGFNTHLGAGNDVINGAGGDDTISTGTGSDRIAGAGGNDFIDGGAGIDTAVFRGIREAYRFGTGPNGEVIIQDTVSSRDGTDVLTGVENFLFLDAPVYRFYNKVANGHFFTTSTPERDSVITNLKDYQYEGVGFYADDVGESASVPVYRFYNKIAQGHFFTTNVAERDSVIANLKDYQYEGAGFQGSLVQDATHDAVFRFYNKVARGHFFTTSTAERDSVIANLKDYQYEGVGFYQAKAQITDFIFDF